MTRHIEPDHFMFWPLPESEAAFRLLAGQNVEQMRSAGAAWVRLTFFDADHPSDTHPDGVYLEGWTVEPWRHDPPGCQAPFNFPLQLDQP